MTELLESKDIFYLKLNRSHESLIASIRAQVTEDVGYALVDEQLTIITGNPLMATWSATPAEQLEGLALTEVLPELVGAESTLLHLIRDQPRDAIDIPRVYRQIYRSSTDQFGRYFDLRVEAFQATAATLLVIITDVTEKARLEFTLRQERNELRLLMAKYKEIEDGISG